MQPNKCLSFSNSYDVEVADIFLFFGNMKRPGQCADIRPDCLPDKLLLSLASTVIVGSESHGTHDHILLSDGSTPALNRG
jgi:hypothetical protein